MEEYDIVKNIRVTSYYKKGTKILHRLDGPAAISSKGTKEWCVNGAYHRLDGPAIEWFDGDKSWYVNGVLHRLDGPATDFRYNKE